MSFCISLCPELSRFLTKAPLGAAMQAPESLLASELLYAPPQFGQPLPVHLNPRFPVVPTLILTNLAHRDKKYELPAANIPALQYSKPLIQSTVSCFGPRGIERMAFYFLTKIEKTLYHIFRLKRRGLYSTLEGLARKIASDFVWAAIEGCTATFNSDHLLDLAETLLGGLLAKLELDWEFACRFAGRGGERLRAAWVERLKRAEDCDLES
ncbi:unnamed protein product [Tuber aestivum]|uniref:Uncharacterized protein n=1 Tax=Tuber aestivum TaxID=59557 RepID=A0A292PWT5_9PEZI|nr:unnamed protein product [Tuber aestivum]